MWRYVLVFQGTLSFLLLFAIFLKYLQYTREHTVGEEDAMPVLREGFSSSSVSIKGFCGALLLPTDEFGLSEK